MGKIKIIEGQKGDKNVSPLLLSRVEAANENKVMATMKDFFLQPETPLPYTIEIETYNRCNNICSFCPVNKNSDTRVPRLMDEVLFQSIIKQLHDLNYNGYISIFSNNEPLLDKRIFDFIDYAKRMLPRATHSLYTNGILLDIDKFKRLVKSLNKLNIDNYNDDFQLIPSVKQVYDAGFEDFDCDVTISIRKQNQILDTRGGYAPNRQDMQTFHSGCILPFTQMIIRPDGGISRCCQDPLGKTTLGNLSTMSILEAWNSKAFWDLRYELYYNGRADIEGCRHCDIFGFCNVTPPRYEYIARKNFIESMLVRRNIAPIYIFDTIPLSRYIFNMLREACIDIEGVINVRGDNVDWTQPVAFDKVLQEHGFIIFASAYYNEQVFEIIKNQGYRKDKDYTFF